MAGILLCWRTRKSSILKIVDSCFIMVTDLDYLELVTRLPSDNFVGCLIRLMRELTHDKLMQFKKDGFYVARGSLDAKAVDLAVKSITRSFSNQLSPHLQSFESDCVAYTQALFSFDLTRYKKTASAI